LFIHSEKVRNNYTGNLKNVAANFPRFDHSYFIDNFSDRGILLAAEFKKSQLIRFRASENDYLRKLFKQSAVNNTLGEETLKIIRANKHYPSLLPKLGPPGNRLKL
jgi:hypothetical protein